MRVLFVCSRNRLRSPTAEHIFHGMSGIETASAGTAPDAETQVCAELIEWADIVITMESKHKRRLSRDFAQQFRNKKIACLNIPDEYEYMDPELVRILWERVPSLIPAMQ